MILNLYCFLYNICLETYINIYEHLSVYFFRNPQISVYYFYIYVLGPAYHTLFLYSFFYCPHFLKLYFYQNIWVPTKICKNIAFVIYNLVKWPIIWVLFYLIVIQITQRNNLSHTFYNTLFALLSYFNLMSFFTIFVLVKFFFILNVKKLKKKLTK